MRKGTLGLVTLLCILLTLSLGMALGGEASDVAELEADINALAAPIIHSCTFGAAGDGCVFDVVATGGGNLQVDTRSHDLIHLWRTTIAIVGTKTVVSNVGNGHTTSFTGLVQRTVANGKSYNVAVVHEAPPWAIFPTTVDVRFRGTALDQGNVTITGPRPRGPGDSPCIEEPQSCSQMDEGAITAQAVDVETITCGTLMTCRFHVAGDTDSFTFTAPAPGAVSIKTPGATFTLMNTQCNQGPCEFILPAAGEYTIVTFSSIADDYVMSLQGVSQSFKCGIPMNPGDLKQGKIDTAGDTDAFHFDAVQGQVVNISIAGIDNPAALPYWRLFPPVPASDPSPIYTAFGMAQTDPLPQTGTYTVIVEDFLNTIVGYTLSFQLVEP